MSECILFYTKLHCDWSLARAVGVGGVGYTISCESINRVLLARQVSFAGSILYNTKEMTITWICCNAFGNTAVCILSFALNKVVKLRVLS